MRHADRNTVIPVNAEETVQPENLLFK